MLRWLLFLFLVIFPFGQLGRIELGGGVNVHLIDIVVGFAAAGWFLRWLGARKPLPPLGRPLLGFVLVAAFSLLLGATEVEAAQALVGSLYLLRWLAYILFYFAVFDLAREAQLKEKVFDALLVVGGAVSFFGWFQYLVFPDTRALLELGWDEHYFRLAGTFLDPGFTGILLVFFIVLVLARRWPASPSQGGERGEHWAILLFLLSFSALALTYSRASYLAFLAGLTAFYIVRRNSEFLVGGALLLLLSFFLLPKPFGEGVNLLRTSTIEARLENYQKTAEIAMKNPLFGVGFNLYRYAQGDSTEMVSHAGAGSDSSLLFVFATTGVVGLVVYLWLWWKIILLGWQKRLTPAGLALLTSTVALLIHSLFSNSLFYPWVLGWLAILLGLL